MAAISYQFIKHRPDMLLRVLEFEGNSEGITGLSGTVNRNIVGLLDVSVIAEGEPGDTWSLLIKVNGNPIITDSGSGIIRGTIGSQGKSKYQNGHSWWTI